MNQQTDQLKPNECPHCGSTEWDLITHERGHEGDPPFCRCYHCLTEWEPE